MLFENHECIQKWNLTSYHYKSWCLGQTSSTVLQISLKAFEKLTKIGFRRAGLGHVKMLNFVFGRGASPPWTPYRGVAPGPQWGPRRPPHPRPNGPSKFWRGAFGPSPKFSRVIPAVWSSNGLILGGGGPIYGIVRMCVPNSPLFQRCQVYDWPPFFQQKVYEWPDFSGFLCERAHFSDILVHVYAHVFRSEISRGCLSSWYYMNWLWYLCNNQQKSGYKKIKE